MATIKDNQDQEISPIIPVVTPVVEDNDADTDSGFIVSDPNNDSILYEPDVEYLIPSTGKKIDSPLERNLKEKDTAGVDEQTELKKGNNLTSEIINQTTKNELDDDATAYKKIFAAERNDSEDEDDNDNDMQLEEDTYTLLIVTASYKRPSFWFALFICFQQVVLLYSILAQQFDMGREKRTTWNVPFATTTSVQCGQFTAIIFGLFTQRDLLQSIPIFIAFLCNEENWERMLSAEKDAKRDDEESVVGLIPSEEEDKHKYNWWKNIFFTYLLRLGVSLLTLFTSFVVIVQSTDIIDLVKDFTALYIIAELDDFAYQVICDGYFGKLFQDEVERAKEFRVQKSDSYVPMCNKRIRTQSFTVLTLFCVMLGTWSVFVARQRSGAVFHQIYKDCDAFEKNYRSSPSSSTLSYTQWGDGTCDPRLFTEECGFDGGDCSDECSTFFQFRVLPRRDAYFYNDLWGGVVMKELGCESIWDNRCYGTPCAAILYYDDFTKYENISQCLSNDTLYDKESENYLYCWLGAESIFDPKKREPPGAATENTGERMILAHESRSDAP